MNPCVALILCSLSKPVLGALRAVINQQLAFLELELAQVQAQLLRFDVLTVPLQAAQAVANQVLQSAQSAAGLLPLGLITGCADLGAFNINLNQVLATATADVNDTLNDLNRTLSFKEELQATIASIGEVRTQFQAILDVIAGCP